MERTHSLAFSLDLFDAASRNQKKGSPNVNHSEGPQLNRLGQKPRLALYLQSYIVETCAKRQPAPLKTDSQIIQAQDYPAISLNAHQLTAFCLTLRLLALLPLQSFLLILLHLAGHSVHGHLLHPATDTTAHAATHS